MRFIKLILASFLLFLLSSCASVYDVYSDYERYVDLSKYKTYKVLNHNDDFPFGTNPINRQRIERSIDRELTYLGYQHSEDPDLLVSFFVKEKTVRKVYAYRTFYRRWNHPIWLAVDEYEQGTLIVDLIDNKTEQVVWHGAISKSSFANMRFDQDDVDNAVQSMFEKFQKDIKYYRSVAARY